MNMMTSPAIPVAGPLSARSASPVDHELLTLLSQAAAGLEKRYRLRQAQAHRPPLAASHPSSSPAPSRRDQAKGGNLIPFTFDTKPVRVLDRDGEPWWVLVDVCGVLEIGNPSQAATRLDDDERDTLTTNDGAENCGFSGPGAMPTIISESGLWSLVLTSRKPEAKRFKKWLTAEVIPAIRKTGSYRAASEETPEEVMLRALTIAKEMVEGQRETITTLRPKAAAFDRLAGAEGYFPITDVARMLRMPSRQLFDWLAHYGWIYKRPGGAYWLGYVKHCHRGELTHRVTTVQRPDGSERITEQVLVTARGLARLAELVPLPQAKVN